MNYEQEKSTIGMNSLGNNELFKGQFIGMYDMNGKAIHEGDAVRLYYKGELVICKVIYVPDWAMFCLQWPDGYKNKFPMNPEKYQVQV